MSNNPKQSAFRLATGQWLSLKAVAGHFGLKEDSAERWVRDGTVPPQLICHNGWRKFVHPDALPILEKKFEAAHT